MRYTGFPKEFSEVFIDVSNGYRLLVGGWEKIIVRFREHMDLFDIGVASLKKFRG